MKESLAVKEEENHSALLLFYFGKDSLIEASSKTSCWRSIDINIIVKFLLIKLTKNRKIKRGSNAQFLLYAHSML